MPRRVFRCATARADARGGFLVFAKKQENTGENTAMRFQKGQSGNPAGRPRGVLNRATVLAQELLSARVESIAGKLIELAEGGDMRAIRVCMDRLVRRSRTSRSPSSCRRSRSRPTVSKRQQASRLRWRQAISRQPRLPYWQRSSMFTCGRSTAKGSTNAKLENEIAGTRGDRADGAACDDTAA
jgi:hypothetical protein